MAMKFLRLILLLVILRPCPACLANEVVAEIATPQAVETVSGHATHDDCQCPHEHGDDSQGVPKHQHCPCCSLVSSPARVTPPVTAPRSGNDTGASQVADKLHAPQLNVAAYAETSRKVLPDRNQLSLPLLI